VTELVAGDGEDGELVAELVDLFRTSRSVSNFKVTCRPASHFKVRVQGTELAAELVDL